MLNQYICTSQPCIYTYSIPFTIFLLPLRFTKKQNLKRSRDDTRMVLVLVSTSITNFYLSCQTNDPKLNINKQNRDWIYVRLVGRCLNSYLAPVRVGSTKYQHLSDCKVQEKFLRVRNATTKPWGTNKSRFLPQNLGLSSLMLYIVQNPSNP